MATRSPAPHRFAAPDAKRPMLSLTGVRHRRGDQEVLAVDRLDVWPGQRLAVLGPNGAGKTTMLRLLAAVDTPTAGTLESDGRPWTALDPGEQTQLRRHTAYLSQRPALLNTTALRNVELPLAWRRVNRADRRRRAVDALDRLGVADLAGRRTHTLSGGEAQRVALARALVTDPRVLLLDEPAAALDAQSRETFLADLERVLGDARSMCVVHVSHRPGEALRLADQVAVLTDGHIAQLGTGDEVLRSPTDATVARLVGYQNVLDVTVDDDARVHLGNSVLLTKRTARPGPATLAVWAAGLHLTPAAAPAPWVVTSVRTGPGRVEVVLTGTGDGGGHLVAHLPWSTRSPSPGDRVQVSVTDTDAVLLPRRGPVERPTVA